MMGRTCSHFPFECRSPELYVIHSKLVYPHFNVIDAS